MLELGQLVHYARQAVKVISPVNLSGLVQVEYVDDPDKTFWVKERDIRLVEVKPKASKARQVKPEKVVKPLRITEPLGLFETEPWVQHMLLGCISAQVHEKVTTRFLKAYANATGETLDPGGKNVLIRRNSVFVAYSLSVEIPPPVPDGMPKRFTAHDMKNHGSDNPWKRICSNELCWELIRLGMRIRQ